MEGHWLESLRAKLVDTSTSTLQQLLLSKAEIADETKRSQDQQFNEDETKIKELQSKLAAMKETLRMEVQALEHKNNELSKEKVYLEELQVGKQTLLQEMKQLEEKRNNLRSPRPNVHDQQVLEQGKKKLKLYKDFTNIQWDYAATKHGIKGYVSNKCDYIHHFCYENQEIDDELTNSLWHEIHLSTKAK
ncbi:PREDICTED: uncharacterized protein LOC105557390 [Vollenhovia emeryi]|uniref:uncharacterized protein LOC105557390 n=1 Tax=Vollenhovia emeryi TaxID=411798 RepID=UPI0005F43189|nr:PREDICTED: uncharacterized protein LOC105557390 [Vollenhovia emeryi]XP_011860016.1 PREDICTED: uncharacterized protein LOC105557390 [Vollenhovia emeryi]XP_011860017.1 PREDICTED: uncharacterized protein LOC105557390 [Vollenhovia emeryi]